MDFRCLSISDNPIRICSSPFSGKSQNLVLLHFWAPSFKWCLAMANAADFSKPPEKLSYPQQTAVAISGLIWARYGTQIIPVRQDYFSEPEADVAQE
ncbi:Mitochondrial pyruvate carrier [Dillenia turbinata]|uniref:Mitochondrial pyruvate carrier n=1 Tax=Dillenia turbinata TaxID=194707 RepID=A0AAN8VUV4_9MAGN